MTYRLVLRPSAALDVANGLGYYDQHGKGDAFIAAVDRAFEQIASRPLMYPIAYENVRRGLLRRFPYSAFFILEDEDVVVLAVRHHRRAPAKRTP